MIGMLRDFLRLETASGVLLVIAAVVAMIVANSPLAGLYAGLIDLPVEIRVGNFEIAKPQRPSFPFGKPLSSPRRSQLSPPSRVT